MKVFVHTKSTPADDWKNTEHHFEQVPRVGDYIALRHDSTWCYVHAVVWLPKEAKTEYQAEIFAIEAWQPMATKVSCEEAYSMLKRTGRLEPSDA